MLTIVAMADFMEKVAYCRLDFLNLAALMLEIE